MSWTCPTCERELLKPNQWHNCIKISVNDLLKDQTADGMLAFDKLLAEVSDWEGVLVSCSKNCIVFVHRQTFFVVRPLKGQLELKFYSATVPENIKLTKSTLHAKRYENHLRIASADDLTKQIYMLIRASYNLL